MNNSTSDAGDIMEMEFGDQPDYQSLLSAERVRSKAAKAIYEARIAAGLTQKQLADLVGTRQSVISVSTRSSSAPVPIRGSKTCAPQLP